MKAQVSVEYMVIIGFVTLITIPLILVYQTFTEDSDQEINAAQLQQIAKKVADLSESMYYLGEPSQTTAKINLPDNVDSVSIGNGEIAFTIKNAIGTSDIVASTSANVTGTLPTEQGLYTVTIAARSNYVEISYK